MRKVNVIDRDGMIGLVEDVLGSWLHGAVWVVKVLPWILLASVYVWAIIAGAMKDWK